LEIVDAVKLHNPDRALHPHVLDAWKAAARRKALLEGGRDIGDLPQARLALEKVERGIGGGAGERVSHEGRPVQERAGRIVGPEGVENFVARNRDRERERPARQCLRLRRDVRDLAGLVARAGASGSSVAGVMLSAASKAIVW